jgi:anhydro-N-acetylmuramic acid kinase
MADPAWPPVWALGLMSGTSMDGVDAALVKTDGERVAAFGPALTLPYDATVREAIRATLGGTGDIALAERLLTDAHVAAVRQVLRAAGMTPADVALIGFHGHTILHRPESRRTWQIGDAARLAAETGIDTMFDFRSADVAAGGQGAPLVPLYHAALARNIAPPVAVLNIGGVANVTFIGTDGILVACDTGPGNALLDDWMLRHTGRAMDADGAFAASGRIDRAVLDRLTSHPWFDLEPPKSLDRDDFNLGPVAHLSPEDGAATLTAFTVAAIARIVPHLPAMPRRWLVTGGGRRNSTLMALLGGVLSVPVDPVEALGWRGDSLEAEAFAVLAVRSRRGLPLSLPGTTGVPAPQTGGRLAKAA